jgi:Uma2 family endonuclease
MATTTTKATGTWRYEDLFDLPEDKRYEIIDGELFEMPGPNSDHAFTIMNLIVALLPTVSSLGARVLTAPLDVFFRGANPVQPDILVLMPDRLHLVSKRGIEGAPDLLVEVLSPSNPTHDRVRKLALYARGGVREYWIVDPAAATIEVLVLDRDVYRRRLLAAGDEPVSSRMLPGLSFPASAAFASPVSG